MLCLIICAISSVSVAAQEDFGDAPESVIAGIYPTTLAANGARHLIVAGSPWFDDGSLADTPDAEADGQPNATATGDDIDGNDDEDGITIPVLTPGVASAVLFDVPVGGVVEGWIDFNQNMTWEAAEQVVAAGYGPGAYVVPFAVPACNKISYSI